MKKLLFILLCATGALFAGGHVSAQTIQNGGTPVTNLSNSPTTGKQPVNLSNYGYTDELLISSTPTFPQPRKNVHFVVESSTVDLDRSEMTWSVNGVVKIKQIGLKTFDVTAGNLGEKTTVTVTALTPLGLTIKAESSFTPAEVDMIWQANTYTPPFYEGKAMFSLQSDLQVVAIPHIFIGGTEANPSSLVYNWTEDGTVLDTQSGYGRNVITLPAIDTPRDTIIEVQVSNYNQSGNAAGAVLISPTAPKALIYENNPRFGVLLNKAFVGDADMQGQEIDLAAYPYFFTTGTSEENVKYEWSTNNQNQSGFSGHTITFRNTDNVTGNALISLAVKQTDKILQFADNALNLHFTKSDTGKGSL